MSDRKLRVAIVIGSAREGRFAEVPGRWFAGEVEKRDDMDVDVLDLKELALNPVLGVARGLAEEEFAERMGEADAFVIVTPEYNHGYPASVKQAIDLLKPEWQAKPVGFVSYGGISGGLRAVEQLRQVFAEVHAMTVRDTVSFHGARQRFDDNGEPKDREGVELAAKTMLDGLAWWGAALKDAREATPYPV